MYNVLDGKNAILSLTMTTNLRERKRVQTHRANFRKGLKLLCLEISATIQSLGFVKNKTLHRGVSKVLQH